MKELIAILGMMSINIFFSISGIFGYKYEGIESSKIYVLYCIFVAILNIFICLKSICKNYKVNIYEMILLLSPVIGFFIYLINIIMNGGMILSNSSKVFLYFILWSVPAIYSAIYIYRNKLLYKMIKWIDIVILIYTFSILFTAIIPFINGISFEGIGGSTYQNASYIAANAYGLTIYFMIYGDYHERFKFTNQKWYSYMYIFLVLIQLCGIFVSGGRGGIVLVFVYSIVITLSLIITKNKKNIGRYIIYISILISILSFLIPMLIENEVFKSGFERVFAFISQNGTINWDGTSGRDDVYMNAIRLIMEKPIFGYGMFGYFDITQNPHNIILELLLGGGIVYLSISAIIFVGIFIRMSRIIKFDIRNLIILILFLYPLTMLMFSGTYIYNSEFWFILSCIIMHKNNEIESLIKR